MSEGNPISGTESVSASTTPSTTSVTTDSVAQAGAAQAHGGETVNSSTKLRTLADLKSKAPELWQKMLEGIGMNICNEMRRHQEELKDLRRKYEKNA